MGKETNQDKLQKAWGDNEPPSATVAAAAKPPTPAAVADDSKQVKVILYREGDEISIPLFKPFTDKITSIDFLVSRDHILVKDPFDADIPAQKCYFGTGMMLSASNTVMRYFEEQLRRAPAAFTIILAAVCSVLFKKRERLGEDAFVDFFFAVEDENSAEWKELKPIILKERKSFAKMSMPRLNFWAFAFETALGSAQDTTVSKK